MQEDNKGRPLPKFGEWDVNNPATAEGYTVIFNKARDEKKIKATTITIVAPRRTEVALPRRTQPSNQNQTYTDYPKKVIYIYLYYLHS